MYPPPGYGPAPGYAPPPGSSPYGPPPGGDPYGAPPPGYPPPGYGAPPPGDPYHQAPPPMSHDPYASHYDAYYRQQGAPPPEAYPPPGAPPPGAPPPGYPPPDYGAPPPVDPHAAHYAHYGAPPPGYGAPPPGYPPGYGAPPPGYGFGYPPPPGIPGYGPPPPGYGAPPPGYGAPRGSSPRRDRRDDKKKKDGKGGGKNDRAIMDKGGKDKAMMDRDSKLHGWLKVHPGWMAVWLEGIDPPMRMASAPNVTVLFVAKLKTPKNGPHELNFLYSSSRNGLKKKDREKNCGKELVSCFDQLPMSDSRCWYQLPIGAEKREMLSDDLERLTRAVRGTCPKATVEVPEPTSFVLVASQPFGPHEKKHGQDADLALLERFDPGFAELMREARRVSGMVRKLWYHAIVWVKPEPGKDDQKPFAMGIGFGTDRSLAKARALHAAEMRLPILSDAMFKKNVPEKNVPKSAVDQSDSKSRVEP